MYATIDIGNLRMTRELLKGNPRMLMYAGCNVDSHVCNSTLRKIMWQAGSRVNAFQVIPIYSFLANFNPKMSFFVPT